MKHAVRLAMMVAALAVCGGACADEGLYAGGSLSQFSFKPDGGPTFNPTAVGAVLGKQFSPNIAGEVRLGTGLDSDGGVEVDHYFGAYAKGIVPVTREFSFYGLLGVTSSQLNFRGGGSASDSGVSYGLGADLAVGRSVSLGLEWVSLVRPSGYDLDSLSLLAKFHF